MKLHVKWLLLGTAAAASLIAFSPSSGAGSHSVRRLLGFHTMYAVDGPFLGATNAIDTVAGDDLPWTLGSAKGSIDSSGHVKAQIHGLVFSDDPKVPPELQGLNDEPRFRLVLTCLSEDENEGLAMRKVSTDGFVANKLGDCNIDAQIELPNPCIAPVIFITGMDDTAWFAASGFEQED
jgi:hypothetical protein